MKWLAVLLLHAGSAWAINNNVDGYQINSGAAKRIYAPDGSGQGACYTVQNNHASDAIFVPTQTAAEWTTFIAHKPAFVTVTACYPTSCYEIKNTTSPADGLYWIDSDGSGGNAAYQVYCDMTTDGGGWTRVFSQSTSSGYFANATDALEKNISSPTAGLYSALSRLGNFYRGGTLEMRINWPGSPSSARNWWTQTSNPTTSAAAGYTPVAIDCSTNFWGGLEIGTNAGGVSAFIDGSVGSGNWYYAIGTYAVWSAPGGIPACDGVFGSGYGVPRTDLWVK